MDAREERQSLTSGIAAARAAFVQGVARGDAAAVSQVYEDEARLLAPAAGLLCGRGAIEAFWRTGMEAGLEHVELDALEVDGPGELAYELGRYTLRLCSPDSGRRVVDRGSYLVVHARRSDGTWRRAAEMFNPDVASAPDALSTEGARPCSR